MPDSISSSLPQFSSLASRKAERQAATVSTLFSSDGYSAASFTEDVCTVRTDLCTLSSISTAVGAVAKAAEDSGVSGEAIDNVRGFASQLQEEGYDTLSILEYLGQAEELAQSDPDQFTEIFSGTDAADSYASLSGSDSEDS